MLEPQQIERLQPRFVLESSPLLLAGQQTTGVSRRFTLVSPEEPSAGQVISTTMERLRRRREPAPLKFSERPGVLPAVVRGIQTVARPIGQALEAAVPAVSRTAPVRVRIGSPEAEILRQRGFLTDEAGNVYDRNGRPVEITGADIAQLAASTVIPELKTVGPMIRAARGADRTAVRGVQPAARPSVSAVSTPEAEAAHVFRVTNFEPLEVSQFPPSIAPQRIVYRGKQALEIGQREGILASSEQLQAIKDMATSAGWSERRLRTFVRVETGRRGRPSTVFEAQHRARLEKKGLKVGPAPEPVSSKLLSLPPMTLDEATRVRHSLERFIASGEVGLKEQFRPTWRVIEEKIGLGEEIYQPIARAAVRIADEDRELHTIFSGWQQAAGKDKGTAGILFRMADGSLQDADRVWLRANPQRAQRMTEVVEEWRQISSKAADELGLPPGTRVQNYITHLFERSVADVLKKKHPIPDEIQAVLHFGAPAKIRNPFLEQRMGKTGGLREDFWASVEAWTRYYLRSKHYTAALQEVAPRVQFLKPGAQRYVKDWLAYRVARRPHPIDLQLSRTLSETVEGATLGKLRPSPTRAATEISDLLTNASYKGALLGNMHFWLMNSAQPFLTVADKGLIASGRGAARMLTAQGRQLLNEFPSIRSLVPTEFLTGVSAKRILEAPGLVPTRLIEFVNRAHAALTGYDDAIRRGLSHTEAIQAGEDLIRRTQFSYREIDLPLATASAVGKPLGQFKTWGINFLELLKDWASVRKDPKNAVKLARFIIYGYLADRAFREVGIDLSRAFNPGVLIKDSVTGFRVTMPAAWQFIVGMAEVGLGAVSGDERLQRQGLYDLRRGGSVLIPYGVQLRRLFRMLAGEDDLIEFLVPTVKEKR